MRDKINAISLDNIYNKTNDFLVGVGTGNNNLVKKFKFPPLFSGNNSLVPTQNAGSVLGWGYASSNSQTTAATNL